MMLKKYNKNNDLEKWVAIDTRISYTYDIRKFFI